MVGREHEERRRCSTRSPRRGDLPAQKRNGRARRAFVYGARVGRRLPALIGGRAATVERSVRRTEAQRRLRLVPVVDDRAADTGQVAGARLVDAHRHSKLRGAVWQRRAEDCS